MAGDLNRVSIIGRLGQDPEVKSLNNGNKVANLSVATSESWKDRDGAKQERTEWHRVVIWNEGLVDIVERYCRKGDKVMIEGKLQTRKWQDQSGADRYSTEVVLTGFDAKVLLLGSPNGGDRDDRGGSQREQRSSGGGQRQQQRQGAFDQDPYEGDVPF